MGDILTTIVEKRKADIERLGLDFGFNLPQRRERALHPFLKDFDGKNKRGVILEVKRASPSKGDIAPDLDSGATALSYSQAGASAISCLTEQNFFKGSLEDLMKVCRALDSLEKSDIPAVLRKDFLLSAEEVEVSFRAGADAVLLIARILEKETLFQMAREVLKFGMSALVEVRADEDLEKIRYVFSKPELKGKTGVDGNFVFGVNSRDLSNFKIDLLRPAMMTEKIREAVGKDARIVFESGVTNIECADAVGQMGFSGLLLGEAAAKNPNLRKSLVESFSSAVPSKNSQFWKEYAVSCLNQKSSPKVKICGLTGIKDALFAEKSGATFLGFIFADAFPRSLTKENRCEKILTRINELSAKKIAVVVDVTSPEAKTAIQLVKDGVFDAIQFHNIAYDKIDAELLELPHYFAVKTFEEYENLISKGEMRVLLDSKDMMKSLYEAKWLAGGITPQNVKDIVSRFFPELIDISGGVEEDGKIGIKSEEKIKELFRNVR